MLRRIYRSIKVYLLKRLVRLQNKEVRFHQKVRIDKKCSFEGYNAIGENTRLSHCNIGLGTYICEDVRLNVVEIGRFCSLGSRICNIKGNHPTSTFVSTHPAFYSTGKAAGFTFSDRNKFKELNYLPSNYLVEIGNDVWIGDDVIIKEGVRIGDGAVIGANSLVTKDIEPYSINIGAPTRIVRYRFNEDDIKFLLDLKWWNKDFDWIQKNYNLFEDIELLKQSLLTKDK